MRVSLLLGATALLGWHGIAAAQTPSAQTPSAQAITRSGGIVGTAGGSSAAGPAEGGDSGQRSRARTTNVRLGTGHFGAGTGGLSSGVGNVTGGTRDLAIGAASGGIGDVQNWGSTIGGIQGVGRGQGAGSGGLEDRYSFGANTGATGGIANTAIGAGTGGLMDQNSLGADSGGIRENNSPRFRLGR